MRVEFIMLGTAILLALVQILWAGQLRTRAYGTDWNVGARDAQMPPLPPLAGRVARAQANLFETLPLFFAAVLGAAAVGHLGWKTQAGSVVYVVGRLVYLPLHLGYEPRAAQDAWARVFEFFARRLEPVPDR